MTSDNLAGMDSGVFAAAVRRYESRESPQEQTELPLSPHEE